MADSRTHDSDCPYLIKLVEAKREIQPIPTKEPRRRHGLSVEQGHSKQYHPSTLAVGSRSRQSPQSRIPPETLQKDGHELETTRSWLCIQAFKTNTPRPNGEEGGIRHRGEWRWKKEEKLEAISVPQTPANIMSVPLGTSRIHNPSSVARELEEAANDEMMKDQAPTLWGENKDNLAVRFAVDATPPQPLIPHIIQEGRNKNKNKNKNKPSKQIVKKAAGNNENHIATLNSTHQRQIETKIGREVHPQQIRPTTKT